MRYFASLNDGTLYLPPICVLLPIGQHIPPYVQANRSPAPIGTTQRQILANGLGDIANVMARGWTYQFLLCGRFKVQPSYLSLQDYVHLLLFYENMDTEMKNFERSDLKDVHNAIAALSDIVNVYDTQVQRLLDSYLVITVTKLVLQRWHPENVDEEDLNILDGLLLDDYVTLIGAVGGWTEALVIEDVENEGSVGGNYLVKQLNLMM